MIKQISSQNFHFDNPCQDICQKVLKFYDKCLTNKKDKLFYLGSPIYVDQIANRDQNPSQINLFNLLLEAHFSDLLEKMRAYLSQRYQDEFFYHPELSYPGFHILNVPKESEVYFNFHRDEQEAYLAKQFGDFKIDRAFGSRSFTVTLSSQVGCEDGLLYVEDSDALEKLKVAGGKETDIDPKILRSISTLYPYSSGNIVIHCGYLHAIYSRNMSKDPYQRITFQGNFTKLERGYVIYW